jgi:hypothetical protein
MECLNLVLTTYPLVCPVAKAQSVRKKVPGDDGVGGAKEEKSHTRWLA